MPSKVVHPSKPLSFNIATHKLKKLKSGETFKFGGDGKADAQPKTVDVFTWAIVGNLARGRKRFPVPKQNITYHAGTFNFHVDIKWADLIPGHDCLAYVITDRQDTETDYVQFRVVGKPGPILSVFEPILKFDVLDNSNDIPPGADLTVTGNIDPYQAGMNVFIERYTSINSRLGNKETFDTTIKQVDSIWKFTGVIPGKYLEPDTDYLLIARSDVPHIPDAMAIHTDSA